MTAGEDGLPGKARENLDVVRRFEDDPQNEASAAQRAIGRASRLFGSPVRFVGAVAFAACGIAVHTLGRAAGWPRREDLSFLWLVSLPSLLTIAVLIRQNRMSDVADRRPFRPASESADRADGREDPRDHRLPACVAGTPPTRRPGANGVNAMKGLKGLKARLPNKPCVVCGRPMAWRRAWAKNWDEVKVCSEACRRRRKAGGE